MNESLEHEEIQPEAVTQLEGEEAGPDGEPDLEQQLEQERQRAGGYLDELQRERAAFINYRKRTEQEKEAWAREASAALIFNLLSVLDDFERAKENIPEDQQEAPWVQGLMLVGRKLHSTLELTGLKPIEALGARFDPAVHEAVQVDEDADSDPDTVVEEYRKGYRLGDRVLRPSMVKVTR